MIEFKWALAKEWTIWMLMLPYIIFLLLLVYYTSLCLPLHGVEPEEGDGNNFNRKIDNYISFFLVLLSVYFGKNEVQQLYSTGVNYFSSIWNYLDIMSPCFILFLQIYHWVYGGK